MRNVFGEMKRSKELREHVLVMLILMMMVLLIPPALTYESWMMKFHGPRMMVESGRLDEISFDSARAKNIYLMVNCKTHRIPAWGYEGDLDLLVYKLKGMLGCFVKLQYLDLYCEEDLLLNISCGGTKYMDTDFALKAYEDNMNSEIIANLFIFGMWLFMQPLFLWPIRNARKQDTHPTFD